MFRVWVSRRFWPWPKKYKAKGIFWCTPEQNQTPVGMFLLVLEDETRVYIETTGKTITYGPEFHTWQLQQVAKETGKIV